MKKLGMDYYFVQYVLFSGERRSMEYKLKLNDYLYEFAVVERQYVTGLMESAGYGFVQVFLRFKMTFD